MPEFFWRGAECFSETSGERPVCIVSSSHDGFLVNQILDNVTTDLLIKRAQPGIRTALKTWCEKFRAAQEGIFKVAMGLEEGAEAIL